MIGQMISHFRILSKIGEGGMGVVYRAEDVKLRRHVALKVLPPELVGNEERRRRFLLEARAAAAITHTNIATVHEVDESGGVVFIAMELVDGKTLRLLIGERPLPIKEVLSIAVEMAEGLVQAHRAHVIHRDLKPDNVIVSSNQHVKLLDFGLAKLREEDAYPASPEMCKLPTVAGEMTHEGRILGTAAYMSPEQARGRAVDSRSDLFSFGSTLYEMVTGRVPFHGETNLDTLSSIIQKEPLPPSKYNAELPPELERIIGKCLEKEADKRYQDTGELVLDLQNLKRMADSGMKLVPTPRLEIGETLRSIGKRWMGLWKPIVITALAVASIAGGVAAWRMIRTSLSVHQGDGILVADFENKTGRAEFDTTVRDALESMLAASKFLGVYMRESRDRLIRKYGDSRAGVLDMDLASKICRAGECAAFLTGVIDLQGEGYRLDISMFHAGRKDPMVSRSVRVLSEEDMLMAIHGLVLDLRRTVGETPQSISAARPPTTRSLLAYQVGIVAEHYKGNEGITLYKKALEIDPGYVGAYAGISNIYSSERNYKMYREYAEKAYRAAPNPQDPHTLMLEIRVLDGTYAFDDALERMRSYQRLYPFDHRAPNYAGWWQYWIYQDPISAEVHYREWHRLLPGRDSLQLLIDSLAPQGKVKEIQQLVTEAVPTSATENQAAWLLLQTYKVLGDWKKLEEAMARLERGRDTNRTIARYHRLGGRLAAGRLNAARHTVASLQESAEAERFVLYLHFAALIQLWLDARQGGDVVFPSDEIERVQNALIFLPEAVVLCADLSLDAPLAGLIQTYEQEENESKSRFVREELQFARGALALIRGEADEAIQILEPLTRGSILVRRHRMLARAYEALGLWRDAAVAYETYLQNPNMKWWLPENPAVWVLDQSRLARVYERLGDSDRARHWYQRFIEDWKEADDDLPELAEARQRLASLNEIQATSTR